MGISGRCATTPALIAETLGAAIRAGELRAGQALPQGEIASRFGVSRIPVREALLQLEAKGLVVSHPNRGAFVVELSPRDVREVYDVRLLVEVDLLARAVPHLVGERLARVEAIAAAADLEPSAARQRELDAEFHRALYAPAGRPRQLALVEQLRGQLASHEGLRGAFDDAPRLLGQHRDILAACRRGDAPAARRALEAHLEFAAGRALDHLRPGPEAPRRTDRERGSWP